jgi:hypothetical protein
MSLRSRIARMIDPMLAQNADRYAYMKREVSESHMWLKDFPDATAALLRILELDTDHWRTFPAPARGEMPWQIAGFRDLLERRRLPNDPQLSRRKGAEEERLRFEEDLDKWMRILGAGISGHQPEAYVVMDEACQELARLRLIIDAANGDTSEVDELASRIWGAMGFRTDRLRQVPILANELRKIFAQTRSIEAKEAERHAQ